MAASLKSESCRRRAVEVSSRSVVVLQLVVCLLTSFRPVPAADDVTPASATAILSMSTTTTTSSSSSSSTISSSLYADRTPSLSGSNDDDDGDVLGVHDDPSSVYQVLICSRNRVPGTTSKIHHPIPNPGNRFPVFALIYLLVKKCNFGLPLNLHMW